MKGARVAWVEPFDLGLSTAVHERVGVRRAANVWSLVWVWRVQLESGEYFVVLEDTGDALPEPRRTRQAR